MITDELLLRRLKKCGNGAYATKVCRACGLYWTSMYKNFDDPVEILDANFKHECVDQNDSHYYGVVSVSDDVMVDDA